jgi:DNA-binding transcriptional LysR family regulator
MTQPPIAVLRPPRFDLRQARAFLFVAEELHFGRAAARLFMTQPALSRTVRSLEAAVGVSLFERSTRRVRLTAAGEAFAAECRLALGHLGRAVSAAQSAAEGREGRLRVGYMDFAINGRLPQLLQAFRARHPRVAVDLDYMPTALQHSALLEGRIDIGFVIGEFRSTQVLNLLVEQDDFVALLPEGHPLAGREALRVGDLAAEPFVVGSEETFSSFRTLMFSVCHAAGFFPRIVQQASNTSGILGMVAAGVGVTIFAGCARNLRRAGVVVKPLADAGETIPTFAAWVSDHPSAVLQRFKDVLLLNAQVGVPVAPAPRRRRA